MANKTVFTKHLESNRILVTREFAAPLAATWKAWTESELLDKWWAPRPWKTETKSMDFREGGSWLYCMVGPTGEKHWSCRNFISIDRNRNFTTSDFFCDENGNVAQNTPGSQWIITFHDNGPATKVEVAITFNTEEDMKVLVAMGFEGGFAMAHSNLDELLAS